MESLTRSLNYELPQELHFDKYAQQILENSKTLSSTTAAAIGGGGGGGGGGGAGGAGGDIITASSNAIASTPTITTFDAAMTTSDFLQKIGASILNSIQLQQFHRAGPISAFGGSSSFAATLQNDENTSSNLDMIDYAPNHVAIDSSPISTMDELQKQLEYDKFMNEVWMGIVLMLILISMVFCVCSCFLYHQFRTWKRNYHSTVADAQSYDVEARKYQRDIDDPVPEYTLVSGLPSYEAALALMQKTPKSCLLVYPPSVFNVFDKNEKIPTSSSSSSSSSLLQYAELDEQQLKRTQQQPTSQEDVTIPLLETTSSATSDTNKTNAKLYLTLPTYAEINNSTDVEKEVKESGNKNCIMEIATAAAAANIKN